MPDSDRIIRVLCTLGPASLNKATIERLEARGVDLFRINLSHTPLEKVEPTIKLIQSFSDVPVCLDTEGAQVRNGTMEPGTVVQDRQQVILTDKPVVGNGNRFTLTPPSVFASLKPNSLVGVDFDGVMLLVLGVSDEGVSTIVLNGGKVGSNKAVVVEPAPDLPPLSEKDIEAVKIGLRNGITHYALSFANCAEDVKLLRAMVGPDATIISKIESKRGVLNLDGIMAETDEILIDRGDLSREVPLENLPFLQKAIIRKANIAKVPVNVATNLMESMIVNRKPTRAELNDAVNTMLDGASGLVLAAETAIGSHPVGTVDIVLGLIERFRRSLDGYRIEDLLEGTSVLLPSLHGQSAAEAAQTATRGPVRTSAERAAKYPAIEVDAETAMDLEQIAHGVYSPLRGFMTREELESVLDHCRLPGGQVWTMPILLQGKSQEFAAFQPGQSVRLVDERTGESMAVMHIEEKFELDLESVAKRWFGTSDRKQPGVARFMGKGMTALGGGIEFLAPASVARSPYQLTPRQTRMLFDIKGWNKIVAFHTRNVPHRGHEHVVMHACERSNADGILIHPVIGPNPSGAFTSEAIIRAYERLISARVPNALLAAFSTYSRYCGAREDVFAALCRKNFGCTHFVLGRDHPGVPGAQGDNREFFEQLGDIGITPIFFDPVHYSEAAHETVESESLNGYKAISGGVIRECLLRGEPIPSWCMREDIASLLLDMRSAGERVLVE